MSTGTYGWRKTLGTEELHATAFAVAEFSFASEWDYNTSGGGWSEAHTGYAQIDLTEQADSYYDLSQTTTYDASGSPSFTGTKAYGRDVTSELTRDIEDWHDEAGSTGSDAGIYTWTSDSYEFGHSWSQNLETSAITTDSYNSVAGEIDWSHGQGLYGLPIGWEDYEFEYAMTVLPPGGGMSNIAGAHGLNPENLYLLDSPGTLPTSANFVDANFEVPDNIDYEAPPTFEDTFGEEEEVSNGSEVEQGKGWLHFATGMIPLYGSGRDFMESYHKGSKLGMLWNGAMFVSDLFVVGAVAKAGLKLAIKATTHVVGNQLAKGAAKKAAQDAAEQGVEKVLTLVGDNVGQFGDDALKGLNNVADNLAGAGDDALGAASNFADNSLGRVPNSQRRLLPGEGEVGTYDELIGRGSVGDDVTPHHIPSAKHMEQHNVAKGDGISINMEHPYGGTGGRHRRTLTYGNSSDVALSARDALARGIRDAKRIYEQDGLYGPYIRQQLQEVIKRNLEAFPETFAK